MSHHTELSEGWYANHDGAPEDASIIELHGPDGQSVNVPFGVLLRFVGEIKRADMISTIENADAKVICWGM